jgi:hypothetical protein
MKNFTLLLFFLVSSIAFSQSTATYNIIFESYWETPAGDPINGISTIPIPSSAHWSPIAIATHKTENSIFEMGKLASTGIENIAETGNTTAFQNEIDANSDADKYVIGSGLGFAQGIISKSVTISEDYPLVSLATMIAPSPDWFIGVNSENLRSGNNSINNGWKNSYTIDVFPYDAGTEDGNDYSGSNSESNPIVAISSLANSFPFDGINSNMSHRIGTVTFNYVDSTLDLKNIKTLENIKLFPNPTQGIVSISNIKSTNLTSIKVYDVLGKLIKTFSVKQNLNLIKLDLTSLNKGLYLIQMKSFNGVNSTYKLAIR